MVLQVIAVHVLNRVCTPAHCKPAPTTSIHWQHRLCRLHRTAVALRLTLRFGLSVHWPAAINPQWPVCCADVGLDKWLSITLLLAAEATVKLPRITQLQVGRRGAACGCRLLFSTLSVQSFAHTKSPWLGHAVIQPELAMHNS